jgi:hypothetical protein
MPIVIAIILAVYGTLLTELDGLIFSTTALAITLSLYPCFSLRIAEQQSRRLTIFNDKGLIKWVLSGLALRLIFAISLSAASSFYLILSITELPQLAWAPFVLISSILFLIRKFLQRISQAEYRYPYNSIRENAWTKAIGSLLIASATTVTLVTTASDNEAIAQVYKSNLLQEIVSFSEIFGFLNDQIVNELVKSPQLKIALIGVVLLLIKLSSVFYLLFSISDGFTLPRPVVWKCVSGVEHFEKSNSHAKYGLAWATSLAVFLSITLWFPVTAKLEYLSSKRFITENKEPIREKADQLFEVAVELINGDFYHPGTIDKIKALETSIQLKYDAENFNTIIKKEIDIAFLKMESNTDIFLDHYFSLGTEYVRIGKMFAGELDAYLEDQLTEALQTGDPFGNIKTLIDREKQIRETFFSLRNERLDELKKILMTSSVILAANQKPKILERNNSPLLDYDFANLITDPETALPVRLGVSTSSGIIVGLVIKKIITKGTLKTLGAAVAKVAGKKLVGAGLGAGIGGIVGSVVPGVGTVIVAGIGTIAGTAAVEWAGIKLDEAVNREQMRLEMVAAINAQKQDLINSL